MLALNIPRKLYILVTLAGLSLVAISGIALKYQYDAMYAQRVNRLNLMTEAAANVIERHRQLAETGRMSEAAARTAALDTVTAMRHGKDGYLFVYDRDALVVAHDNPAFVGRSFADLEDTTGFRFVADVLPRAVRDGVATVIYTWKRNPEAEATPKIGLFRFYKPWGLYIGTGVHIDDLRQALLDQVERLGAVALVVLLILAVVSWGIIRSIVRPMESLRQTMGRLAEGRTTSPCPRPRARTRSEPWPGPSRCSATTRSSGSGSRASRRPTGCASCSARSG